MSVTECKELDLENAREWRTTLNEGTTGRRTFLISVDSASDVESDVFTSAQSATPDPLPAPLSFFPGSGISRAYDYRIFRHKPSVTTAAWLAVVDYKTIFNQQEIDRNAYIDPTARPARISGGYRTLMVPARQMLRFGPYNSWPGGTPSFSMAVAANSAGDPLDPPVEKAATEWELRIEKDVSVLPSWFFTHEDGINISDQVISINGGTATIPALCGKLSGFTFSEKRQENNVNYITIGFTVTIRTPRPPTGFEGTTPSPWDTERLDEGTKARKKMGSKTVWANNMDPVTGTTITLPIPFDGNGKPITQDGSAIPEFALKKYCYRPFKTVDYSVLPWT